MGRNGLRKRSFVELMALGPALAPAKPLGRRNTRLMGHAGVRHHRHPWLAGGVMLKSTRARGRGKASAGTT
jgi:hypothetical protein